MNRRHCQFGTNLLVIYGNPDEAMLELVRLGSNSELGFRKTKIQIRSYAKAHSHKGLGMRFPTYAEQLKKAGIKYDLHDAGVRREWRIASSGGRTRHLRPTESFHRPSQDVTV